MGKIDISEYIRKARRKKAAEDADLLGRLSPAPLKRKPRHRESEIQRSAVAWFRYSFPRYLIFAVPNGGSRNAIEAANMKREGVMAGVSDLIIVADRRVLFVEMKDGKNGRQSEHQKEFQHRVEVLGHRYVVCRSLDDFMAKVKEWIGTSL